MGAVEHSQTAQTEKTAIHPAAAVGELDEKTLIVGKTAATVATAVG